MDSPLSKYSPSLSDCPTISRLPRSKSLTSISSISIKNDATDWSSKLSVLKKLFNSTHKLQLHFQVPNDLDPNSLIFITQPSKPDLQRRNSHHSIYNSSQPSTPSISKTSLSPYIYIGTPLIQQTIPNGSNSTIDSTKSILTPLPMSRSGTVSFKDHTSLGHYRIIKTIGTGAFSTVKLAVDLNTDKKVALKSILKSMIAKNPSMEESVENEINLMKSLNHPNIVTLLDVLDLKDEKCLVLEYVDGGELFNTVAYHYQDLTSARVLHIFKQTIKTVHYLHTNNVCHRDLKLENILLCKNDTIKLTDFGFAKKFADNELLSARCGSEEYTAPEILQNIPYDGRQVDVWALGVVLFALLFGELPFNIEYNEKPKYMYHRIARGEFKFPDNQLGINQNARDLVKAMLQPLAKNRITIPEILKHSYLNAVA